MTNVAGLLRRRAADTPERAAFVEGRTGRVLTWADLAATAARWQAAQPAGPVGLAIVDPLDMVAAYLAGLAAGVTIVPLDPAAPPADLAAVAARLGVTTVVTSSTDVPAGDATLARPPARPALVMSSSGTTGPPKVIGLTEAQLLQTAGSVAGHHGLGPDERGYSPLPLFHINALVVAVLSTVVAGSSMVVDAKFSRRAFWSTVDDHRATWVNLVPAIIGILADAPPPSPAATARVRFARSASAPLAPATLARFQDHTGVGVLETYGMTEAASQITANPLDPARRKPGSVGRAVGLDLRVVGPTGDPVAAGQPGEVEIRGAAVSAPAGTWLRTGDLGHLDADGFLFLEARVDDVINRGGEKVNPREIENVLLEDRRVTSAVVVGSPDPILGEVPVAFVLVDPAGPGDADGVAEELAAELTGRCERGLAPCKRPARITVARSLPAGPTGKVRRAEVRRMAAAAATDSLEAAAAAYSTGAAAPVHAGAGR